MTDINNVNLINRPDIDTVVFVSDVHFGVHASSVEWLDNVVGYFDNFFIPELNKIKLSGKNPCVVVAGDYFDNRQTTDINVMSSAINVMKRISCVCPVYMMIGNHDIYKKYDLDVTSLSVFDNFSSEYGVELIYSLTNLTIADGTSLLLVSWVGDYTMENNIITKYKNTCDYIVLHTEISGMTYDNNRPIVGGLNCDVISGRKILSGHIHKRQEGKKAIYFGSPYHTTKSDIGNVKGIYVLDSCSKNLSFIENTYSPKYIAVDLDDITPDNESEIFSNNYVYVVSTKDKLSKINTSKFVDKYNKYCPKSIEFTQKEEAQTNDVNSSIVVDTNTDVNDVFIQRLSLMELNDEQKKILDDMNTEYIKQAMEELSR